MVHNLMRTDLGPLSLMPGASLREALLAVDRGRIGIALVIDDCGRLMGTVTDGDLRRAILQGTTLDASVENIMWKQFAFVDLCATVPEVRDLMHSRSVKQVPVLDAGGRAVGLYFLSDLAEITIRPNWAVIMAGGEGRRLRPLTESTPKPMLNVGGRPLLENIVALLVRHGFRELFISINYLGEQIENYFKDGRKFGCHITYLKEDKPLGTAGALSLLPARPDDPVLVVNGDLLTDVDLSALMDCHSELGYAATQCVREYAYQIPFGVVSCKDGKVIGAEEKPVRRELINAGIYVLSPGILKHIPANLDFTMPEFLARIRDEGSSVAAFPVREQWTDIGRLEDYHRACNNWSRNEGE